MTDRFLKRRSPSLRGFTLVELLLVVIIIALFASAAGGGWVNSYKKNVVCKRASEFLLAAKYARLTAVEKRRSCKLVVDEARKSFYVMARVADSDTGVLKEQMISNQYTKPVKFDGSVGFEEVKIFSTDKNNDSAEKEVIMFYANGSSDSAVVQFGDGKHHYTVHILAATGKAKLRYGTSEESPVDIIDLDEI